MYNVGKYLDETFRLNSNHRLLSTKIATLYLHKELPVQDS